MVLDFDQGLISQTVFHLQFKFDGEYMYILLNVREMVPWS